MRRRRQLSRLVWLLLLAALPAQAVCDSTDSCLAAVEAAQRDAQSVSAQFIQTKHLSLLDEPLMSSGRFMFKRPDRIRLDIEHPRAATIIINGRDINIPGFTERDKQQLAMTPMAAMFAELGAMFGGSAASLRKNFEVSAVAEGQAIAVTLIPKAPAWQRMFKTIRLRFAEPSLALTSMQLDDALGDRLEIALRDVQRNPDLPDSLFTAPPSAAQ